MSVLASVVHAQHNGVLSIPKEAIFVPEEISQSQIVWSFAAATPLVPSGDIHIGVIELLAMEAPRSIGRFPNNAPISGRGEEPTKVNFDGGIGDRTLVPVARS